jgi:hypothetical protein
MAKLKTAMTGVRADIPTTLSAAQLDASIAAARAKIKALTTSVSSITLDANSKALEAKIAAAAAGLAGLDKEASSLQLDFNSKAATAKIAALDLQATKLYDSLDKMTADVEITAAVTKIDAIDAEIRLLKSSAQSVVLGANSRALNAAILAARANLDVLQKQADNVSLGLDTAKIDAQIVVEQAKLDILTKSRDIDVTVNFPTAALAAFGAALNFVLVGAHGGSGGGGSGGGFGGFYFFGRWLGATIGNVKLWHVALDGAAEALISIGLAATAAAVGIAVMEPAADDIVTQLKAIDTVNEAFGSQIPSLSRQWDQLSKSMAPQTIEAFGGAMKVLEGNTGVLAGTAKTVVNMFDDWIARLDIWAKAQGAFGGLLKSGVGFLEQFAQAGAHVLDAIDNLVKQDPGTAHFLLDIITGVAAVIDWVSKLPAPLLEIVLAFHSFYVWGNLIGGLLKFLPGLFGLLGEGIVAVASSPALIALALAAFEIARAWGSSSKQVVVFIASIQTALSNLGGGDALTAIPAMLGQINTEMSKVKNQGISPIIQGWNQGFLGLNGVWQQSSDKLRVLGNDLSGVVHGGFLSELKSVGSLFSDWVPSIDEAKAAELQLKQDMANLNVQINQLLGSQRNLDAETGNLIKGGYSFSQALALMDLAGVKATDSLALMSQKVQNLISGYQDMSVRGGILANSVNAITFASALQESKVSTLNSSWDTFIQTVTGGASGFTSFETNINGMFAAAATGGVKLGISNGRASLSFTGLAGAATSTKASFTGLNNTSLALQETFNQSVTDANAQLDSLTTMAAAAGLGAKGTEMLTQATKDMIVQMLPAAKSSSTLTAELYALAQRGGYQGADSFQALATWIGNVKNPMLSLQGIVGTFTKASAGLTTDVQNLSVALGNTLTVAMSQAVFLASGGQKAFTNFATAVLTSKGNIDKMKPSAAALIQQLYTMTGSVSQTHDEFMAFARGALGLTAQQANLLWNNLSKNLTPAIAGVGAAAQVAAGKLDKNFLATLKSIGFSSPGITSDVNNFSNSVLATGASSVRTQSARQKLIEDLIATGMNAGLAVKDVNNMQTAINNLHGKTVSVGAFITGSGGIKSTISGLSSAPSNVAAQILFGGAKTGAKLPGYGGGDVVPILAEPGEAIVSKETTRKFSRVLKAMGVPGFAAGGTVAADSAAFNTADDWAGGKAAGFDTAAASQFVKASVAQFNAATAAQQAAFQAAGLGHVTPGYSASVLQEQSYAASLFPRYGWVPAYEMPALISLWNQESGWNPYAANPTSNARGIPQSIQGWSSYAPGDYKNQIIWGENYIHGRYGDPLGAWAHEVANNWYHTGGKVFDNGGTLSPGANLVWNGTNRPEPLVPASGGGGSMSSGEIAILKELRAIRTATQSAPVNFGRVISGGVSRGAARGYYGG